ncbi:MAG: homocysteine S-methyltransferase [Gammaproteobacteria bacterium]|nr:homocysteine S-methyltransferase [Gammaproteobacteria bacterium]
MSTRDPSTAGTTPSSPLGALLARVPVAVLDGALATELERRGADLRDPLWSAKELIEAPDRIREVHLDYFRAGADVASTATYQATFEGFARRGVGADEANRLMHAAVAIARAARDEFWADPAARAGRERPLIAASIGPYGAMLGDGSEYRGGYGLDRAALRAFHRPRLATLARSGADLLGFETVPSLEEALALAEALAEWPTLTAWLSFSCRDGAHTAEGQPVAAAAAALEACPQIVAIGVNCTAPRHLPELLGRMAAATDKPLIAYPNSGEHYDAGAKCWQGTADGAGFARAAAEWYRAGARVIGGCCRTGPAQIRAIRAWVDALDR